MIITRDSDFEIGDFVDVRMQIVDIHKPQSVDKNLILSVEPCSRIDGEDAKLMSIYWQRITRHLKPSELPYDGTE